MRIPPLLFGLGTWIGVLVVCTNLPASTRIGGAAFGLLNLAALLWLAKREKP